MPVAFDAGAYTHGSVTLPRVDAIAARDRAGKLWLAVTNLDPNRPVTVEATLAGVTPRSAAGQTLTAPKVDSVNTFEAPNTVVPKAIAAHGPGRKGHPDARAQVGDRRLGGIASGPTQASSPDRGSPQMKKCRLVLIASAGIALVGAHASAGPASDDSLGPVLFYRQPAKEWVEALPIGNGRLGGMVFGGVPAERIQLNEDTFWSGGPYDPINPEALTYLPKVRQLIREGRYKEAQDLADQKLMGRPRHLQAYQPLGDLRLVAGGPRPPDGLPPRAGPRPRRRPRPLPDRRHHVHARGLLERARPGRSSCV